MGQAQCRGHFCKSPLNSLNCYSLYKFYDQDLGFKCDPVLLKKRWLAFCTLPFTLRMARRVMLAGINGHVCLYSSCLKICMALPVSPQPAPSRSVSLFCLPSCLLADSLAVFVLAIHFYHVHFVFVSETVLSFIK